MEHLHGDLHDEFNRPMLWLIGFFVVMLSFAYVFATVGNNRQHVAVNEMSMTPGDVLMAPITQPAAPEPTTTGQRPSP